MVSLGSLKISFFACRHGAILFHKPVSFPLRLKRVNRWERIASRRRPAFSSHLISPVIGMYGPPQSCKRKTNNGSWSALMYSALVESSTPGHDGYPLALVPIMWTVWKDLFR